MVSPLNRVMGNMYGREDAIKSLHCISPEADGCGRRISEKELAGWDRDTFFEYRQSGWCWACQGRIFADPEESSLGCTCGFIDVGVGVPMPIEDPHCKVHADSDFLITKFNNYDPDMREDEPPLDISEIEWNGNYV